MANADGVGEGETVDVWRDSGDAHKCLLDKGQRLRPFAQGKIRFVASGVYVKDQRATAAAVAGATSARSPSLAAGDGSIHPPSWPATARHARHALPRDALLGRALHVHIGERAWAWWSICGGKTRRHAMAGRDPPSPSPGRPFLVPARRRCGLLGRLYKSGGRVGVVGATPHPSLPAPCRRAHGLAPVRAGGACGLLRSQTSAHLPAPPQAHRWHRRPLCVRNGAWRKGRRPSPSLREVRPRRSSPACRRLLPP